LKEMTGETGRRIARGLVLLSLAAATLLFIRHLWFKGLLDAYLPGSAVDASFRRSDGGKRSDVTCGDCHDEAEGLHLRGPHRVIDCEDCHGGTEGHVRDDEKVAGVPPFKSITRLCTRCHRDLANRRRDAPTLNLEAHLIEVGALFSDRVCFDCHRPHDPRP
jgi:hypothetical protein